MSAGFTVWLTGLSGAGKSTISTKLVERLRAHGRNVEVLRFRHENRNRNLVQSANEMTRSAVDRVIGFAHGFLGPQRRKQAPANRDSTGSC